MNETETAARVAKIRACQHGNRHYFDGSGNRCCYDCAAFVRPNPAAEIVVVSNPTMHFRTILDCNGEPR